MLDVTLDKHALKHALPHVQTTDPSFVDVTDLELAILEYLSWCSSEDRDFSDEMLAARKRFSRLIVEQPDECHSKLWEDCLRGICRIPPNPLIPGSKGWEDFVREYRRLNPDCFPTTKPPIKEAAES